MFDKEKNEMYETSVTIFSETEHNAINVDENILQNRKNE